MRKKQNLELRPIGVIHSPYKDTPKPPYQGYKGRGISQIEVFEEFEQGLQDIEGFSHIIVIYWFHKSQGYHLLVLLAAGGGAGFASGLLGIGGGAVMIPVTYWLIQSMGVCQDLAIKIAFGTSLLVILPTAISGSWRHNKEKAVRWKTALALGSCALGGAVLGATLATHLPGEILEKGFGGLVLVIALWMGLGLMPGSRGKDAEPRENVGLAAACGFPIGMVTGLTGLGGAVRM